MPTVGRVSAIVFLLLWGCASRQQSPGGPTTSLAIDSQRAMDIARQAVAANDDWVERATFEPPVKHGDRWLVKVQRHPQVIGGDRVVVIDRHGHVISYIRGM